MSHKHTTTTPSDREIRIERLFDAPKDRVWQAFTDPEQVKQWWGRGNDLVIEKFEPVRGGHWRFVERSPEGAFGFEGRFGDLVPGERVVQTFEWDGMPTHVSLETMTLEAVGDQTRIVATSLFFTREDRDGMLQSGMEQGLAASYAALDRLLAR